MWIYESHAYFTYTLIPTSKALLSYVLILDCVCNGRTRSRNINSDDLCRWFYCLCCCCLVPIYAQEPVNCHSAKKRLTPLTHKMFFFLSFLFNFTHRTGVFFSTSIYFPFLSADRCFRISFSYYFKHFQKNSEFSSTDYRPCFEF